MNATVVELKLVTNNLLFIYAESNREATESLHALTQASRSWEACSLARNLSSFLSLAVPYWLGKSARCEEWNVIMDWLGETWQMMLLSFCLDSRKFVCWYIIVFNMIHMPGVFFQNNTTHQQLLVIGFMLVRMYSLWRALIL